MKIVLKSLVVVGFTALMFSCGEKKGLDKIKAHAHEASEDFTQEVEEASEESKEKKIKIKFGK